MVKHKKLLYIALLLFVLAIFLNLPYPHDYPYGEAVFLIFGIPIRTLGGFHVLGIINLVIFIAGIYFLTKSLEKYHVRLAVLVIFLFSALPPFLIDVYQKTFAEDIYAVAYDRDRSSCEFDMVNADTLRGKCELFFENYSKDSVQFELSFYDAWNMGELEMEKLMNNDAPYKVYLSGKQRKRMEIQTDIDVSGQADHLTSGTANGLHIIMKSGKKKREL